MRYLIFLRDLAAKGKGTTQDQTITRFAMDAASLKSCFLCPSLPLDHSIQDVLNKRLEYVTNITDLIVMVDNQISLIKTTTTTTTTT
jgi:hypothetical protein